MSPCEKIVDKSVNRYVKDFKSKIADDKNVPKLEQTTVLVNVSD